MNNQHSNNLQEQLKQTQLAYQTALEISQFKAGYLGRIAHELRSPLSSLMGLHQLIIGDLCEDPQEEREFINTAYQYAKKLMALIDEVVEVSKIEGGRIELENQPVLLTELLEQIYTLTHLQCANRNLKLVIPETNPQLSIVTDEKRLIQALVSLIDICINNMETGSIVIQAQPSSQINGIEINLDTNTPLTVWYEPINLINPQPMEAKPLKQLPQFSTGMKLMLSQTLLETLGGELQILELPSQSELHPLTRLQCLLPSVVSDSGVEQLIPQ
jgi:K+-sensing histidine kinase KdpD